ncbi:hypothetical protein ACJJTC_000313 [Scirpophaga incertulas]
MISLVSLLVAAALVCLQSGYQAYAQIEGKNDLRDNLQPNIIPMPKKRALRPFINIAGPPPESARLIPGTLLELSCEVIGFPAPTAQWLKNGEPLTEFDDVNEIMNIHPTSLARLTSKMIVSSAANGDVYTCVATSGVKQQMASTTVVTVAGNDEESLFGLEALFRKPSKPIITEYYNEVFQEIGTSILLPCKHFSTSPSQVYWFDGDEKPVFGNPRMRILPTGDLLIPSLHWDDMGNYSCTVKNAYGKDTVETFLYPNKKQFFLVTVN